MPIEVFQRTRRNQERVDNLLGAEDSSILIELDPETEEPSWDQNDVNEHEMDDVLYSPVFPGAEPALNQSLANLGHQHPGAPTTLRQVACMCLYSASQDQGNQQRGLQSTKFQNQQTYFRTLALIPRVPDRVSAIVSQETSLHNVSQATPPTFASTIIHFSLSINISFSQNVNSHNDQCTHYRPGHCNFVAC